MSSSWMRVGPNSRDKKPMWWCRQSLEWHVCNPRDTKALWRPPEVGRGPGDSLPEPPEETNPVETLVSDFWSPELRCCCSVTQLCPARQSHGLQHTRLPCSSPSLELAQPHVHWVGDAIQPSHPLSPPFSSSPPSFQASGSLHQVDKVLELFQCLYPT